MEELCCRSLLISIYLCVYVYYTRLLGLICVWLWVKESNLIQFSSQSTAVSPLYILSCVLVYISPPLVVYFYVVSLFSSSDRVASFGFLGDVCSSSVFFPPCMLLIHDRSLIQYYVCIPLIYYLPIVSNQFRYCCYFSLYFIFLPNVIFKNNNDRRLKLP